MQVPRDAVGICFAAEHQSLVVQECKNQLDSCVELVAATSNATADAAVEILRKNMEFALEAFRKLHVYPCIALDESLPSFINGEDGIFALQLLVSSLSQTSLELMIPSSYVTSSFCIATTFLLLILFR